MGIKEKETNEEILRNRIWAEAQSSGRITENVKYMINQLPFFQRAGTKSKLEKHFASTPDQLEK